MKVKYNIVWIAIFVFNLARANDCNYSLKLPSIYQDFSNSEINQSYTSQLSYDQNSLNPQCIFYSLYFSKGNSQNYERKAVNRFGEFIRYNLYTAANRNGLLKERIDVTNRSEYLHGYLFRKKQIANKSFFFNVPNFYSGNLVRGGIYTDNILVSAYSLGQSSTFGKLQLSQNMSIIINVPKIINISLTENGGVFDGNSSYKNLNFGNLESGKELSFDMRIASNAGYRVMFSSLNNGNLKSSNGTEKISYVLFLNNVQVNLSNSSNQPVLVATGNGVTSSNGVLFPSRVRIGEVKDNASGNYEDFITITAQTIE